MTVDVQDMREVIAQVAALTGQSAAVGDSVDVVVAGIGRVGVTAVVSALEKAGWPASEWGPGQRSRWPSLC